MVVPGHVDLLTQRGPAGWLTRGMPIKQYGVLRAAVVDRRVETTDTPHNQIRLPAAGVEYRAAVNVRSQEQPPELLYLAVDNFRHPILERVAALADGFTDVAGDASGAALDYIRGNLFQRELIDPTGWQIADRAGHRYALGGRLAPGETARVAVAPPVQLGNRGGTVTLLDARGLKVDGVAYTS